MGAAKKERVCLPREMESFSPTTILLSEKSVPKKFFIIAKAFCEETTTALGYFSINTPIPAE